MAKTNISFNNKNYNIDESSLSTASAALRQHLSSVMNGTGATINFGGTAYNIDSTKLSTATNAFISHLGTVAGNGYKVKVGGVEYGVDSAKMTGAVAELEAFFGELGGGNGGETGGFPITWNTMDVAGNPAVELPEMAPLTSYVKVSDYCPSLDEILHSQITFNIAGYGSFAEDFVVSDYEDNYLVSNEGDIHFQYCSSDLGDIRLFSAPTGKYQHPGIGLDYTFPEPGLYAPNYGALLSANIDFALTDK